jgi:hypothetical protein
MPKGWRSVDTVSAPFRRVADALRRSLDRIGERLQPSLVRWEALPGPVQLVVTFPIVTAAVFLLHLVFFSLSVTRSFFYGVFWAIPATAAVVIATKTEAAKRRHGGGPDGGE